MEQVGTEDAQNQSVLRFGDRPQRFQAPSPPAAAGGGKEADTRFREVLVCIEAAWIREPEAALSCDDLLVAAEGTPA